jgi:hypothetical protein
MADARVQIPFRVSPELRERIEEARGQVGLNVWLVYAVELAMAREDAAPAKRISPTGPAAAIRSSQRARAHVNPIPKGGQ